MRQRFLDRRMTVPGRLGIYSFHYGGLAIQDLADPRMLLNLARQRGIGVELPLV